MLCGRGISYILGIMSHNFTSVIDVEYGNSVNNFLLNNKIFTFHDLFTFIESINKQQPLF